MSGKQLGILIAICAILGVIGISTARKDGNKIRSQAAKAGEKVLPDLPVNDVTELIIDTGDKNLTVKIADGRWRVPDQANYPADFEKVSTLLRNLMDAKTAQIIAVGDKDYGRLELDAPGKENGGTLLSLNGKDGKTIATLLLGKEHQRKSTGAGPMGGGYPDGRYVTVPDSGTVAVVPETFSQVSTDANNWIDKTFVKVSKIKSGEARTNDGSAWIVSRKAEADSLTLEGEIPEGKELDTSKMTGIDSTLSYPNFSKIAGRADAGDWGFDGDEGRAFIAKTFDGRTWTLKIGKKQANNEYPLQLKVTYEPQALADGPKDETEEALAKRRETHEKAIADLQKEVKADQERYDGWVYMVASYTIDDLLNNRETLIKDKEKPKEDANSAPPAGNGAIPAGHPPIPFLNNSQK